MNKIKSSTIVIGYYTVDCTIPEYSWTSAQMTLLLDEPIVIWARVQIYFGSVQSTV